MLDKAYEDELIKLPPHEIVHFAATAEEAVRWVESEKRQGANNTNTANLRNKKSVIKQSSFFSASPYQNLRSSFYSMMSSVNDNDDNDNDGSPRRLVEPSWLYIGLAFLAGASFGIAVTPSWLRKLGR
jgi:hypothetical protein